MTRYSSEKASKEAAKMVATLMAASARTAPKARGIDSTQSLILDGDDVEKLAAAMERLAQKRLSSLSPFMVRDANNVRKSSAVLLIGVTGNPKRMEQPLDCGACGYDGCEQLAKAKKRTKEFTGPNCIFQAVDLGIALGSAVKLASELGVDNRIMFTIGRAAKDMQLLDSDVIFGIPLSISGKSPFFDRG